MTSHIYLIIGRNGVYELSDIIRDLKSYTSRRNRSLSETLRPVWKAKRTG
ncbi:hypothetical protein BH23BAC1_BH23BAC1_48930 [soil metagenome]